MFRVPVLAQRKINKTALKMIEPRHGNYLERGDTARQFEKKIKRYQPLHDTPLERAEMHYSNLKKNFERRNQLAAEFEALALAADIAQYLLDPQTEHGMSEYKRRMYTWGLNPVLLPARFRSEIQAMQFAKAYDLGMRHYVEEVHQKILEHDLGGQFARREWTSELVAKLRFVSAPLVVETIAIVWQLGIEEA